MTNSILAGMRVLLCVCTYKRPEYLRALLPVLLRQVSELDNSYQVRLLIVDNDAEMSASQVVEEFRCSGKESIEYIVEPRPGVGNARNAAFCSVQKEEWLIFFDDDQMPERHWLANLLAAKLRYEADVFVGPVLPDLPDTLPIWAVDGWPWGRTAHSDGAIRQVAGFGNILMSPAALADESCWVSDYFLTGHGEDTYVTLSLSRNGFVIRQVANAGARERVSTDRLSQKWVLDRAKSTSMAWASVSFVTGRGRLRLGASAVKLLLEACSLTARFVVSGDSSLWLRARTKLQGLKGYVAALSRFARHGEGLGRFGVRS